MTRRKEDTMQVVTINEGEAGQLAINLELVTHARFYPGKEGSLFLNFYGEDKTKLSVAKPNAEKVWAALTRK